MPYLTYRDADVDDARAFTNLLSICGGVPLYRAMFGQFTYSAVLEYSLSTFGAFDGEDDTKVCYALAALNDSVSCSADPESFELVLNEIKPFLNVELSNSLFINFFVCDDNFKDIQSLERKMCRKMFADNSDVDYVLWLFPNRAKPSDSLDRLFRRLDTSNRPSIPDVDPLDGHSVFVLYREDFLPRISVREARVEDNDDLVPILEASNPNIVRGQQDFFLADLIAAQDERNKFYVGVNHRDTIVGMLATSLDVNVGLITKIFDIEMFPDIIIQKEERPLPPPEIIGIIGDLRIVQKVDLASLAIQMNCLLINAETILPPLDLQNADEAAAMTAISCLNNAIRAELQLPERTGTNTPLACIVVGFPRCDEEASAISQKHFVFDGLLEIGAGIDSLDLDEDDALLQSHVDAVDTLHQLTEDFNGGDYLQTRWVRASCQNSDPQSDLADGLSKFVLARAANIEANRLKDLEEPPHANAFALSVFCIEEEYESRAEDLLTIAFEDNLSLDYCVFMAPCNARPSRLMRSMVAAPVRLGVSFDQVLYVLHREVLVTRKSVAVARFHDSMLPMVKAFVQPLDIVPTVAASVMSSVLTQTNREHILDAIKQSSRDNDVELRDNPADTCFVATMSGAVVAVAVLSRKAITNDEVIWLRANYRIDELVSFERHRLRAQAYITHWVADPLFNHWTRYFLREIMRAYKKTLLLYLADPYISPPREVAETMIPVLPQARMQPFNDEGKSMAYLSRPGGGPLSIDSPLFCISKCMLAKRKPVVSTRVLVVGGNPAAYAILEALVCNPSVYVSSISFVIEDPTAAIDSSKLLQFGADAVRATPKTFSNSGSNAYGSGLSTQRVNAALASMKQIGLDNNSDSKSVSTIASDRKDAEPKGESLKDSTSSAADGDPEADEKESGTAREAFDDEKNSTSKGPKGSVGHVFEGEDTFGCLSIKEADISTTRELLCQGIAHRITIVRGRVTDIDRENRAVVVSDEIVVEYDLLILAAGTQDNSTKRLPTTKGMHPSVCAEKGIFGLGNRQSDKQALQWVLDRSGPSSSNRPVVVAGSALEVVVAVGNLLAEGVDPERLTMVVTEENLDSIGNHNLVEAILPDIQKLKVYWSHALKDVQIGHRGKVTHVQIKALASKSKGRKTIRQNGSESKGEDIVSSRETIQPTKEQGEGGEVSLVCASLLCCGAKVCDADMFAAINDSGLVYDGGLVVDETFRTVDPYIYAVGDFTRYSRIFRHITPHGRYNKREIGLHLATQVIAKHLDPSSPLVEFTRPATAVSGPGGRLSMTSLALSGDFASTTLAARVGQGVTRKPNSQIKEILPTFQHPRTVYMTVPGNKILLVSTLPVEIERDTSDMVTGEPSAARLSIVKMDHLGMVLEFVTLGSPNIEERNLGRIVGWHESFLNNAVVQFDGGRIDEWVEFFRDPWMTAVLHDKFSQLAMKIKTSLQTDNGSFVIIEDVLEAAEGTNDDALVAEHRRQRIGDGGDGLSDLTRKIITDVSLDFLQRQKVVLTRFHVPSFDQAANNNSAGAAAPPKA